MKARMLICALVMPLLISATAVGQSPEDDQLVAPEEEILFYTSEWEGERMPDGRPEVSEDLLERLENIRIEDAWQYLHEMGYENQYEGGWKKLHADRPIVGQVLTAQYMPERPDIMDKLEDQGTEAGHVGPMNTWPIDMLREGDVYLADSYGKIEQGTLIGSNLGNSIFDNSSNGVIFNGSLRDGEDLEEIDGFNAFVRDWHPSFLEQTMLTGINVPIRIGKVSVMPGDVVLAKKRGIVFIPPHLVEGMVVTAEIVKLRDEFAQQRMEAGVYTAGQIDTKWTDQIEEDFMEWLRENRMDQLPVSIEEMEEYLQKRTW